MFLKYATSRIVTLPRLTKVATLASFHEPGFLYHRELELYEKSGIPAAEVLKLATIKSAEITGVSKTLGSIEVGKEADLILIDGNPLDDISDIRKVEWTMKGGNLFYSKELYASMGIKHFK